MNQFITYAIDEDGVVLSRMNGRRELGDNVIAYPVLQFDKIGKGGHGFQPGDFNGPMIYKLESMSLFSLHASYWKQLKWTKKIPLRLKNRHRRFWKMKPLPCPDPNQMALPFPAPLLPFN